jgi:hypothetical protein
MPCLPYPRFASANDTFYFQDFYRRKINIIRTFLSLLRGETESTWYCGHFLAIVLAPDDDDDDDCGAIGGMRIDFLAIVLAPDDDDDDDDCGAIGGMRIDNGN